MGLVLEETLDSPMDGKIKPVNPKGNQPWIFIGRTDAEAETLILWSPDVKSWLIGKDSDAGKDWGQDKRVTEDEMVGWHHQFNGHEFEQTLGDSEGQGSLACFSPWGCKETDTTERLNNKHGTGEPWDSQCTQSVNPCQEIAWHSTQIKGKGSWMTLVSEVVSCARIQWSWSSIFLRALLFGEQWAIP